MNIDQIRSILKSGSYSNWNKANYIAFINYLSEIDVYQLDYDTQVIAFSLLEKDSHLIIKKTEEKIKLPTRMEQNKKLPPSKENKITVVIISFALVFITFYLLFVGLK